MEELKSLVARAQSGDLDAYGEIVRRFQDMAYGYAFSILGDFHLAEDAAQEAFIHAYRDLANLREPAAFPGWFRRIVFKYCDRLTRRKRVPTAPLDVAAGLSSGEPGPAEVAEKREMKDAVLAAIRALPENERIATTLYYINGYSQEDIAEFLEVPETTVNNRLHASRKRLKERMIGMVDDTLKANAPNERFSREVIDALLARPRPLEIEGHPVSEIWHLIRSALPEYEVVGGDEVEDKGAFDAVQENMERAYHVDGGKALRTQMTVTTFKAMHGRTPPVRLLAAGRVFRPDPEDARHLKVFHQVDGLCVQSVADLNALKGTVGRVLAVVFEPAEVRWRDYPHFGFVDCGMDVEIKLGGEWLEVAGSAVSSSVPRSRKQVTTPPTSEVTHSASVWNDSPC